MNAPEPLSTFVQLATGAPPPAPPAHAQTRRPKTDAKAEKRFQRAVTLMKLGQWLEAVAPLKDAIARQPRDPMFWLTLAQAYRRGREPEQAEAAVREALALDPAWEPAQRMLADLLMTQGRAPEATRVLDAVVKGEHADGDVHLEMARARLDALDLRGALEHFMKAATLKPTLVPAHVGMAACFDWMGMPAASTECYRTATTLAPERVHAWSQVVYQSLHACRWATLDDDLAQMRARMRPDGAEQPVPFCHVALPGATAAEHRRSAAAEVRQHTAGIAPLPALDPAQRRPGRVRVAYVSNDFHDHATTRLMVDVVESHDRGRIEQFLYSYGIDDGSVLQRRLQAGAEHWVPAREMSVPALARRIRDDEIDILVDLKGFTRGARTGLLGYRAAPVQVAWLGYPGTMGSPLLDYVITDDVVTPPHAAANYDEHFAILPDCYQPNDRRRAVAAAPTRADCGLPDDAVVFASFNNTYKITPGVFGRWCRILEAVPGSVLWLLKANADAEGNLVAEAAARGIARERLVFAPAMATPHHIARLALADMVLDTLPYNAHTTASDALWAGVPVVTCPGDTFASRVASSLTRAAGVTETIADSLDAYQRIAVDLAHDRAAREALRGRLRQHRDDCALFDTPRFARGLETLYERMLARWRDGLPPARIDTLP
jgi:predicted O-linked N-acetylglucosamine transferase (SPINDLY family)